LNKKFFSLSDVKETKVLPAYIRTNFEAGAFDLSTDFLGDGSGSYFTVRALLTIKEAILIQIPTLEDTAIFSRINQIEILDHFYKYAKYFSLST
jgi:hypothetical protein